MNVNNNRPVSGEGSRQTITSGLRISRTLDESNFKNIPENSKAKRRSGIHFQDPRGIKENAGFYLRSISNEKVLERVFPKCKWEKKKPLLDNEKTKRQEKRLYEGDSESNKKRKKIESIEMFSLSEGNIKEEEDFQKNRLLVGEADLSFAVAFIKKHPEMASFITATTYENEEMLDKLYSATFPINKVTLLERDVEILHEVDATKLHEDPRLRSKKYGHIHFNFPHDGKAYKGNDPTQTPIIINNFLESARNLLIDYGHVHMALVSKGETQTDRSLGFYHGIIYKVADGTLDNGYKLYKKRKFDAERYEGYAHKMTNNNRSTEVAEKNGREYIFEKIDSDDEHEINENKKRFRKISGESEKKYLPDIETDNESSDYEV